MTFPPSGGAQNLHVATIWERDGGGSVVEKQRRVVEGPPLSFSHPSRAPKRHGGSFPVFRAQFACRGFCSATHRVRHRGGIEIACNRLHTRVYEPFYAWYYHSRDTLRDTVMFQKRYYCAPLCNYPFYIDSHDNFP